MDAIGGASGGAHEAGNAFDATLFVFVEAVDAPEIGAVHAAVEDFLEFATFFGVLEDALILALAIAADGTEHVAEGDAQALDDGGEVD